ncbi:hypothetical protein SDC9_203279 [bioreactor metagenome]|uniref:Uncharacterized protein n=1 Tax=bioreactor metagenome TaxID=1076179 RepID=A0A645IVZ7_9ZZZZ
MHAVLIFAGSGSHPHTAILNNQLVSFAPRLFHHNYLVFRKRGLGVKGAVQVYPYQVSSPGLRKNQQENGQQH